MVPWPSVFRSVRWAYGRRNQDVFRLLSTAVSVKWTEFTFSIRSDDDII